MFRVCVCSLFATKGSGCVKTRTPLAAALCVGKQKCSTLKTNAAAPWERERENAQHLYKHGSAAAAAAAAAARP